MNKVNFEQTGGFPLETNTLSFLQSAYGSLAGLADLGGQNYILNGCDTVGANVSNGTVVIDGEVLPFIGGAKLARVIIEETVAEKTFEDGVSKPVYYTRVAKMVAAGGVLDFDSLKKVSNLLDIADRIKDQQVVQWTPVSDNELNVIDPGSSRCWMFKMGKLVVLTGDVAFTYVAPGLQRGFGITGYPVIGDTAGIQRGFMKIFKVPDIDSATFNDMWKNSSGQNLYFSVSAPENTKWSISFSITLFTI
ncbi:hypothetical protein KO02_16480 [Sphingobacterium sp. ML3W]|uniref:hypothetical protein n=1 Tax=Sphingobacterium sp. ML3W TaxID=1538644 RepID=UPI0004F8351D|nr:hypothetical protein [Sphingobacterium sp. ML3W]AIM38102.1 hypothetical protein KO02_16480 [Sphingobacterium sp. ML3W]